MTEDNHKKTEHKEHAQTSESVKTRLKQEKKSILKLWAANRRNITKTLHILLVIALIVVAFILIQKDEEDEGLFSDRTEEAYSPEDDTPLVFYEPDGKWYKQRDDIETVLLIGIDKYDAALEDPDDTYANTQQNDFNMLVAIDHTKRTYTFMPINRDTITEVTHLGLNAESLGTEYEQLALAHTYGTGGRDSCRNVVRSVESLLYGTEIDHYAGFTMDVVPIVTDECGGIKVHINDDFSKVNKSFIKGQDYTLTGKDVMDYVRSRSSMQEPTNLNRMERQKVYMESLRETAKKKIDDSSTWAFKTISKITDYIYTDYYTDEMAEVISRLSDYKFNGSLDIKGTVTYKEYADFYPDEAALKDTVIKLFYTEAEVQ